MNVILDGHYNVKMIDSIELAMCSVRRAPEHCGRKDEKFCEYPLVMSSSDGRVSFVIITELTKSFKPIFKK